MKSGLWDGSGVMDARSYTLVGCCAYEWPRVSAVSNKES